MSFTETFVLCLCVACLPVYFREAEENKEITSIVLLHRKTRKLQVSYFCKACVHPPLSLKKIHLGEEAGVHRLILALLNKLEIEIMKRTESGVLYY